MPKFEDMARLVDEGIALDKRMKADKKRLEQIKATLTTVAFEVMDNKSLKFMQIFGTTGHFNTAYKEKFEVDNFERLFKALGEVVAANIARKEEVKYDVKDRFKEALVAVFKQEYSKAISVDQVLQGLGLDSKTIKMVKKKLKGDYLKDKKVLESLGIKGAYEEELYAIRLYKNYELVDHFFGELTSEQIEAVEKSIFIEDGLSAGFEYQDDNLEAELEK